MTDDQLPQGESPPLPPPPGAFEAVQRRAAARRLQRGGIAGVLSLALFAGAFAVGGLIRSGTDEPDSLVVGTPEPAGTVHPGPQDEPTSTPTPSPISTSTPESSPTSSPATSPAPSPSTTASPVVPPYAGSSDDEAEHVNEPVYAGRVVDGAGRPVAGAWLITVLPERMQGTPIGADGTYEGSCGGPRELIAMWDLSSAPERQPRGMRNLAATWVNGGSSPADGKPVPCPTAAEREALDGRLPVVTTALPEGGVLTGRLTYVDESGQERPYPDGANPGGGLYCKALFSGLETAQCADWDPVGGRYRFAGLPTGAFGLQGMYGFRTFQVQAGRTTEVDWYECDGCRQGEKPPASPSPSA